ncbi:Integrase [Theobroma cacao]|nr:Integrase [Theobroma cacao]
MSEVLTTFLQWKALIEKQTGKMIKRFRTDNGLKICKGEFDLFCKNKGIIRHRTVIKTPQQNGIAERMNRTLIERARCMLSNAGLSKVFWTEAINMACYLVNRSLSTAIELKTPKEGWSGKPADYSILRVFGFPVYVHVSDGKLELRTTECIFLGYAYEVKGYQLWCTDCKFPKFMVSRDITFDKSALLCGIKSRIANTSDQEVGKQVEFEINALVTVRDDNFAGDLDSRRSQTGYVFTLSGSVISWKVVLQSTVALSTTEAEYMAVTEAVKEALWLKSLVSDLGFEQTQTVVFCDSQSAIHLTKNHMFHERTKHIQAKCNFVREIISKGEIVVKKIATDENPTDMLIKSVSGIKFKHCLDLIGVHSA